MCQMLTRRFFISVFPAFIASPALAQSEVTTPLRLALVAPRPGDDYYNACRQGALEAAVEVDGVQLSYTSPATADAALQAKLVDDLVTQRYDAIIISPIASDVVIAACGRAVQAGIKVISIDHPLPPDARVLHLASPDLSQAAPGLLQIMNTALGKSGEIALLSTEPTEPGHVTMQKALQKEWLKADYSELSLVTTVYGGGDVQRSYAEALAILQAFPKLRGIIAPELGGMAGAARAVMDMGRGSMVKVTGIGLPSRMVGAMQAGVVPAFVTWSPVDVGYAAVRIALALLKNEAVVQPGIPIATGRLGQLVVDDAGAAAVAELITVDPATLDKFADLF